MCILPAMLPVSNFMNDNTHHHNNNNSDQNVDSSVQLIQINGCYYNPLFLNQKAPHCSKPSSYPISSRIWHTQNKRARSYKSNSYGSKNNSIVQNQQISVATQEVSVDKRIRILTMNLMRDKKHEYSGIATLRWEYREPLIIRMITEMNPHILAFQECGFNFKNNHIETFLDKLRAIGYKFYTHIDKDNNNEYKLAVVTGWREDLGIRKQYEETRWLAPDPCSSIPAVEWDQKTARPIGINRFSILGFKKPLWLWNTHFGHNIREREYCAQMLPHQIRVLTGDDTRVILLGDFNDFKTANTTNNGLQEKSVLDILCDSNNEYFLTDLSKDMETVIGKHKVSGTIFCTSNDIHATPLYQMGDRVDLILGHNMQVMNPVQVCNQTYQNPEPDWLSLRDRYLADHFALSATVFESVI